MSLSPKDMDWLNGKDVSSREIALAFGVPGQLVGIPGQQTYANNREARLALYEDTILPLVLRTIAHINNWLVPHFGTDLELRADIDEIPALVLRRERVWDRVQGSDFLTTNEKRAAVGYDDKGPDGGCGPGAGLMVLLHRNRPRNRPDDDNHAHYIWDSCSHRGRLFPVCQLVRRIKMVT